MISAAWKKAEALRESVQEYCRTALPESLAEKAHRHQVLGKEDYDAWMKLLDSRGWATGHWPLESGGLGWSPLERFIFEDTLGREGMPWVLPFGVKYVGPVIYAFGSEEQKQRFLPSIKSNDEFWCQGYSEPNAGSDLYGGLSTFAELQGDHYVVNGQKVWTTYAQWADWIFCLVKTNRDPAARQNLSFLLIDMKSPGITVKAIDTMDGYRHVNEVFFENVKVPVCNLIGEQDKAKTYSNYLLKNERFTGFHVGWARHVLDRLWSHINKDLRGAHKAAMQERASRFELRFMAFERMSYAAVESVMRGAEVGSEPSFVKIRGTELLQEIGETLVEALGMAGIARDVQALHEATMPPLGPDDAGGIIKDFFYNRAATIFGGSTEVQRNIVARGVLGL
jgi:alkylation response protein AidB-like acyl-CoA dehydrogenase